MIKTLLFDFDGLIVDTELHEFQIWQMIYQEFQCELTMEQWAACVGGTLEHFDPYVHLETLLDRPIEREVIRERTHRLSLEGSQTLPSLPGVESYLAEARRLGLKLGLASNSPREWVMGHLERLGLHTYFDNGRFRDDVTHRKPHPELYLSILEALETPAHEAIALEDSSHGVSAAQQAGIFCVAVPNTITMLHSLDHADLRLQSMADMPLSDLIAEVENRRQKAIKAW